MKHVLVDTLRNHRVAQVVDTIEERFDVHPSLEWHECSDDTVERGAWNRNPDDGSFTNQRAMHDATPQGQRDNMKFERQLAYGPFGDQLDAIYRDMRDGTTTFIDHIDKVKSDIPKVAAVDPIDKDRILDPD